MSTTQLATNVTEFDWAALEDHIDADGRFAPPTKQAGGLDAKREKHTCDHCGGRGTYQNFGKCYACNGRGYFLTSQRERAAARKNAADRKTRNIKEATEAFDAQYPTVRSFLAGAMGWSSFAAELVDKLNKYGSISENAAQAVLRMQAKCEATKRIREDAKHAGDAIVDLSAIRTMFETAVGNGYKRPIYRAGGLVIKRAPDSGRNPGALYITKADDDTYLGKIVGTAYTGKPAPALIAIAADPRGEAIRYGRQTGRCSCCGAELTNAKSIELGIGPICATKWGL